MPMTPAVATARARIRDRQKLTTAVALILIATVIVLASLVEWNLLDMLPWYARFMLIALSWGVPIWALCSKLSDFYEPPR